MSISQKKSIKRVEKPSIQKNSEPVRSGEKPSQRIQSQKQKK